VTSPGAATARGRRPAVATVAALHHDRFDYPLPPGHRFPLGRYRRLREALEGEPGVALREARAATRAEVARVPTDEYIDRALLGRLGPREQAALGLPWSARLVARALRSTGATIEAAWAALDDGVGINLGGGTHHAAPDAGRGFCLFNDVVCAVRTLRAAGALGRVLVIDLDVHQGDGTHACCRDDPGTITASVNGGRNYPFRRVPGDIEIDLPDGVGDDDYLAAVEEVCARGLEDARPELCFYVAGADPWEHDRLGRLEVTQRGLGRRDALVQRMLADTGVPVCVVLGGGYGEPIEGTIAINARTVRTFAGA
jgi:acetoin utilization deacetylase AcuC-like enzyme